jgi:hypothetical protein
VKLNQSHHGSKETGNEEVSTAAAKQSKDFREQKLTIGLDVGDRSLGRMVDFRKSKSKST